MCGKRVVTRSLETVRWQETSLVMISYCEVSFHKVNQRADTNASRIRTPTCRTWPPASNQRPVCTNAFAIHPVSPSATELTSTVLYPDTFSFRIISMAQRARMATIPLVRDAASATTAVARGRWFRKASDCKPSPLTFDNLLQLSQIWKIPF